MRPLIAIAVAWLWCSSSTASAQFYSATFGYGTPLVIGYGHPGRAYPYGGYPIGYGYRWPYFLDSGSGYFGPYIAPPLYVPAEQLGFGPQAIRQFMGVEPVLRPIVNHNIIVAPPAANGNVAGAGNAANVDNATRLRVRQSNAEARNRAWQFIEFGDKQFTQRNLAGAYDRFKKAAEAAPDLAEPYFRMGHTLADLGRYEQAAAAFRRGLGLSPEWPHRGFVLADFYGGNQADRNAALRRLERSAVANPDDANVQFVAGIQYFFDGRHAEARMFLESAKRLGEPSGNIEAFFRAERDAKAVELDI